MSSPNSRLVLTTALVMGALFAGVLPTPARAEESASPAVRAEESTTQARAQALFDQGLAAARNGQLAKACPLFRASNDVEPRTGTLLNLGTCYEKNWQTASAWATYREAETLAHREARPELAEQARQKVAQLEPRLVRLTVQVPPASRVPGLVVQRDGVALQPAEYDVPIPIDPGEHKLLAQAPNHETWEQSLVMTQVSRSVGVPVLARGKKPSWWTTGRKVGVGVGAAGVASLIGGTVLALYANSKYQIAQNSCATDGKTDCNPGSHDDETSARSLMTPATIFFVSGAVLAAGGGALVLLSKPKHAAPARGALVPTRVALDVAPGFVGLSGRFE